jgi:hypothetical protein
MSDDLSPTMDRCLEKVKRNPGRAASKLPGGLRTVSALMRRGLVEVSGEETEAVWTVYPPAHKHEFKMQMHMDGCHYFSSTFQCGCGAHAHSQHERDLKADPYSAVWMDYPDTCERCAELMRGARPQHDVVIYRSRKPVSA